MSKHTKKTFTYLGLEFTPIKKLIGANGQFENITKRISNYGDTPNKWNYNNFYVEAAKAGAGHIDLFEVNGQLRIAATNYLFHYE